MLQSSLLKVRSSGFQMNNPNDHVHLKYIPIRIFAGFRLACHSTLCRYIRWLPLAVSELQLTAATLLWLFHRTAWLLSWIQFNCVSLWTKWRVVSLLTRHCFPLEHPSAPTAVASGTYAVVQISPSKWQCGERHASLKAAHNSTKGDILMSLQFIF